MPDGAARQHANGVQGIAGIDVLVRNAAAGEQDGMQSVLAGLPGEARVRGPARFPAGGGDYYPGRAGGGLHSVLGWAPTAKGLARSI